MSVQTFRGDTAGALWLGLFQLLLGLACLVDAASKAGWLGSSAGSMSDFQPSPFGMLSAALEGAAGLGVLIGFRTRLACGVLAGHLVVGLLVAQARHGAALAEYPNTLVNLVLLVPLLVWGPSRLSVDRLRRS